jgi:phosphonoacetate hydrolase
MMSGNRQAIEVNGRRYAWPSEPVVVVCIDGSEPDYDDGPYGSDGGGYIERAIAAGCMPFLAQALETGTRRLAESVVPSFTNPNNLSIVTGVPPSVHGICGNYFYDPDSDSEVMMNDPGLLRVGTIFAAFQKAGARVGAITAKDKLRRLLGHGLTFGDSGSFSFSAEQADRANPAEHGIEDVLAAVGLPLPTVYSADLSEFVFAAGVALLEGLRPDILYLSTTDYVQHKHAPGSDGANAFYRMMDGYFAKLDRLGATLALTADHGMKAKHDAQGDPDVIYLQALMDDWLGAGVARVICPITDPYVVHHGALGGFVTIYLREGTDAAAVISRLSALDGIDCALDRAEGCRRFELPEDRVGDAIVTAARNKVLGTRREDHDLTGLTEPLRSHGGPSEQRVPLLLNRRTPTLDPGRRLRNFDIFDVALNHVQA